MICIAIAYHKNDNPENIQKFENMLSSINIEGNEDSIYITLDGATPDYINSTLEKFRIDIDHVVYSEVNIGNYALKFRLLELIKNKFKFIKFCDFDDRSCTYNKLVRICKTYINSDLIICRTTRWSCFVNYWEKIFSIRLITSIPFFKCFTGGDVIIAWMSFYLCYKYNWKFDFCGESIYYKTKEASRTCREKKPEEYLKLETESNEIKNILFYAETIESKHIYEKSKNILDIDFDALEKTIYLNDFMTHMRLHYKF